MASTGSAPSPESETGVAPVPAAAQPTTKAVKGWTLLVERDDHFARLVMGGLLARAYDVVRVRSTTQAVAHTLLAGVPRMMVTDLCDPSIDPLEWVRQVRRNPRTAELVALCGPGIAASNLPNVVPIAGLAALPLTPFERLTLQAVRLSQLRRDGPLL